jgi:hypothetical protein
MPEPRKMPSIHGITKPDDEERRGFRKTSASGLRRWRAGRGRPGRRWRFFLLHERAPAWRIAGVARRRTRVATAVPAEGARPQALPQQKRKQAAGESDEQQDPADDVDVDRGIRIALVHSEREDCAHGDQDQADGKSHGSGNPPWGRLRNGLRRE